MNGLWILILCLVFVAFVLGTIYLTMAVGKFGAIRRFAGEKKWKRRLLSFGIVFVVFVSLLFIFDAVNAVIIFLHEIAFFLLFTLVMYIIRKVTKKEFRIYWQGWIAVSFSIVYLSVGFYLCNNVWQTEYDLTTDKQIAPVKLALIADSHIGATFGGEGFLEHIKTINEQKPDVLLVAGDFIDDGTSREDMISACEALGKAETKYGVFFCYGNHDKGYYQDSYRGYTSDEFLSELEKNNVHVLADEAEYIRDDICIIGRKDKSTMRDRLSMSSLMEGIDKNKYVIVLDHEPNDYDEESEAGPDLVLSGHTHGGQLFPVNYFGEWFGVNDKTYGYERRGDTDFIVTSGISDWEIVFKTGTKSEYDIIEIGKR